MTVTMRTHTCILAVVLLVASMAHSQDIPGMIRDILVDSLTRSLV